MARTKLCGDCCFRLKRWLCPKAEYRDSAQNPNLSDQEAEKLFEKLVDEGQIAMEQEGWWRWTT